MKGKLVVILIALVVCLAGVALVAVAVRPPMPDSVLAGCSEPLPVGVPDLRGYWRLAHSENIRPFLVLGTGRSRWGALLVEVGMHINYVQRIEQCGLEVAVTDNRGRAWAIDVFRADGIAAEDGERGSALFFSTAFFDGARLVSQGDRREGGLVVERELVDDELRITTRVAAAEVSPMRLFLRR